MSIFCSDVTLKNPKWRCLLGLVCLFSTNVSSVPADAYINNYVPLDAMDKKHTVQLATVSDAGLKDGKALKIAGAEARLLNEGQAIVISGTERNGHPWTVTKSYYGLGTSFFEADLDRNGTTDIIILQATGACGIAPPAVLTTIMFDALRRPHVAEVSGYFSADKSSWGAEKRFGSIEDIIALSGDKHAVIVCQQLDAAPCKGRYHSYWRFVLYKAENSGWTRLSSYRGRSNPMLLRYLARPNRKVIAPPVASLAAFEEVPSQRKIEQSLIRGTITDAKTDVEGRIEQVVFSPGGAKDLSGLRWVHPILVRRSRDSYNVFVEGSDDFAKQIKEMAVKKAVVKFVKPNKQSDCPAYIESNE